MRTPIEGGNVSIIGPQDGFPEVLVALAGHVYWAESGTIKQLDTSTGGVSTLASSNGICTGIAADATAVYWVTWGSNSGAFDGSVMKVATNGGTPVVLAGGQENPTAIALDEASVYWTTHGDSFGQHGSVFTVPKSGGVARVLATEVTSASSLAVAESTLYWTSGRYYIIGLPLKNGIPETIASGHGSPRLVADASGVYWTNYDEGTVTTWSRRCDRLIALAAGQGHPTGIAVDADHVYWVNSFEGEVMAMLKPVTCVAGADPAPK